MLKWNFGGRKDDPRLRGVHSALDKYHMAEDKLEKAMGQNINLLEYFLSHAPRGQKKRLVKPMLKLSPPAVVNALEKLLASQRGPSGVGPVAAGGFRVPSLQTLGIGVIAVAVATAASAAGVAVATQMPKAKANSDLVMRNAECSEAHVLHNSDGYAGALPATSCISDIVYTAGFEDSVAMEITEFFASIEGGVFVDETLYGQDMMGVARWVVGKVPFSLKIAQKIGFPFTSGGSSGWQTAVEAYHGTSHSLSTRRKPEMVIMGIRLAAKEFSDDLDRAHFVSRLATIAGYGGTPIGGLHGAMLLFEGVPDELYEFCIQASAMGKPFLLTTGEVQPDKYLERNALVLKRAEGCIRKSAKDPSEQLVELNKLAGWVIPDMPDLSEVDVATNRTLRQETRLAQVAGEGRLIELTVSRDAYRLAQGAGDLISGSGALAPIRARLPDDACFIQEMCEHPVGIAFVAAEIVGDRLVPRAVRTNMHGAIYGPVKREDGSYNREVPAMGEASIAKMAHIIVAADLHVQSLCSKAWGGIKDSDGFAGVDDCDDAASSPARRSVAEAIALSVNLGFINFASEHEGEMKRVFAHLGWMGDASSQATIEAALGLGVLPTPAEVMQTLAAIEVGRVQPLGMLDGDLRPKGNGNTVDLYAFGLDEAELRRAQFWMSKPVSDGTVTPTVRNMEMPRGCVAKLGKTGTTFDAPDRLSKNLVLSVHCGSRKFILYGGVWTLDQMDGSVGELTHKDLAPMLSAILAAGVIN